MWTTTSSPALLAILAGALALAAGGCSPQAGSTAAPAGETDTAPADRTARGQRFPLRDITAAAGIDFVHHNGAAGRHHYVETMGPGVALFDSDGDGDLDLYVVDGGRLPGSPPGDFHNRLYRNRGDGVFEDHSETSGAGDDGYGMGVAVGDADGDGDLDLYVLNYGPNAFYRNLGDGRFERLEVGAEDPAWSVSGAFFDADGDGDLDLYVANYLRYDAEVEKPCRAGTLEIYCSPEQFPAAADRFYRNHGGGPDGPRFTEVSAAAGIAPDGRGMGVAVNDVDGDGDADLYVANDRSANLLYLGEGGVFVERGAEAGVGYGPGGQAEGGMGVVIGDFTGDGRTGIFLTNFQKEPNRLFVRAGGGTFFDDHSTASGLGFPSTERVGWGIGSFDLEGDGDLDLAIANGHVFDNAEQFIPGNAFAQPDQVYVNDGSGNFQARDFPGTPWSSRGVAAGDLDGDGDQDLVITSCGGPLSVWRNDADEPRRFLVLRLAGRPPNTFAYGAKVSARVGGRTLYREVAGGGSYASHSDVRVTLGLGDAGSAERVEVRWPDGTVEEAVALEGGQEVVWRQGEGIVDRRRLGG